MSVKNSQVAPSDQVDAQQVHLINSNREVFQEKSVQNLINQIDDKPEVKNDKTLEKHDRDQDQKEITEPVKPRKSEKHSKKEKILHMIDIYKISIHPMQYKGSDSYSSIIGTILSVAYMIGVLVFLILMLQGWSNSGEYRGFLSTKRDDNGDYLPDSEQSTYNFDDYIEYHEQFTSNLLKDDGNKKYPYDINAYITSATSLIFLFVPYLKEDYNKDGVQSKTNRFYGKDVHQQVFEEKAFIFDFYLNDLKLAMIVTSIQCQYDIIKFKESSLLYSNIFGENPIFNPDENNEDNIAPCQFSLQNLYENSSAYYTIYDDEGNGESVTVESEGDFYEKIVPLLQQELTVEDSYVVKIEAPSLTTEDDGNGDQISLQMLLYSDFYNPLEKSWADQIVFDVYQFIAGQSNQYTLYYKTLLQQFIHGWFSEVFFYETWFELYNFQNPSLGADTVVAKNQDNSNKSSQIVLKFLNAQQLKVQEFSKPSIQVTMITIFTSILIFHNLFNALGKFLNSFMFKKLMKQEKLEDNLDLLHVATRA